jgi:hypothetical protein
VGLDAFDQFLTGIDIDAGLTIGYGGSLGHSGPSLGGRGGPASCGILHDTMSQHSRVFSHRYLRPAVILGLGWAALFAGHSGRALTRAELYQATVPFAERCESAPPAAFQAAMKIVLVRVTGRSTAGEDPALAPLLGNAHRYVQQCRAAADKQLWMAFDGPAIERWLTQNSQPLWGHERPRTFVWLAAQTSAGTGSVTGTVVTADDTSELKAAIDAAALARGLPLLWPSAVDVQRNRLDYAGVSGTAPSTLADMGRRLGGEGVLIGRANGTSATANVRWTHLFQDRSSEYSGTLEGVNRAADVYAELFAASGTLVPIDIEVTGVGDLRDYASVQTYLESLTFISHESVVALTGSTIRFRLATRGGAESLQRTLSLNSRLQAIAAGDNGIQRFQFNR